METTPHHDEEGAHGVRLRYPALRSGLVVPGFNPSMLEKAAKANCDLLHIELEDGVANDRTQEAREVTAKASPCESSRAAHRVHAHQVELAVKVQLAQRSPSRSKRCHKAILRASGGTLVGKVLESLQMPVAYRLYQWRVPERERAVIDHHRKIIEALRAGNAAGVRAALEGPHPRRERLLMSTAQNRT